MKENQKPLAVTQIVIGVILILMSVSYLIFAGDYLSTAGYMLFGFGNLFAGIATRNDDQTSKGKELSYLSGVLMIFGSLFLIYHLYINLKK